MIERQVIVTWETKKPPEPWVIVPVTISLKAGHVTYDHTQVMADWTEDEGWYFYDGFAQRHNDDVIVHAWADLEPYKGVEDCGVKFEHG